jgi:hypothetical protein
MAEVKAEVKGFQLVLSGEEALAVRVGLKHLIASLKRSMVSEDNFEVRSIRGHAIGVAQGLLARLPAL